MRKIKNLANFTFLIFVLLLLCSSNAESRNYFYNILNKPANDPLHKRVLSSKEFDLRDFDRLKIGSAFTINVYYGEKYIVKVSGKQENVDDVDAVVKSGELIITFKENKTRLRIKEVVTIDITMPLLRAVEFGGTSSSVVFPGFKSNNFVAYISGTAYSEINMESQDMYLDVTGACTLKTIGRANQLKVNANGTSVLDALNLSAGEAILDVSGTSSTKLNVAKTIKANASGASSIRYKGSAKLLAVETSKLSSIKKIQ